MGTEWRAATAANERLEGEEEMMRAAKGVPAEPNCCTQQAEVVDQQKQRRCGFDEMILLLPGGVTLESKTAASRNASGNKERAEAREVFLRMEPSARVSRCAAWVGWQNQGFLCFRSLRVEWLLNHSNGIVQLAEEEQKVCPLWR